MRFLRAMGVLVFAFSLAAAIFAQDGGSSPETGAIEGSIHDASGIPVGGAQVSVGDGAGFEVGAVANEDGRYAIPDVPVGTYGVTISADGFKPFQKDGVKVRSGRVTEMDAKLARDTGSNSPQAANHDSF